MALSISSDFTWTAGGMLSIAFGNTASGNLDLLKIWKKTRAVFYLSGAKVLRFCRANAHHFTHSSSDDFKFIKQAHYTFQHVIGPAVC
jgi:hypothetical protein